MTSLGILLFVLTSIYVRYYAVSSGAVVNHVLTGKWAEKYSNILSTVRAKFDMYLPYIILVGVLQITVTL